MNFDSLLGKIDAYFTRTLIECGPTPAGVDWNSAESQELRFAQLLRLFQVAEPFSINDHGCGYGALIDYMVARELPFTYAGFDISAAMVAEAHRLHPSARFTSTESQIPVSDYTIASGIFNVRLDAPDEVWRDYICTGLESLRRHSTRGFAFNLLTSYSDVELRRPNLYYADPLFFFDHCKRNFSRQVALFHDYPLYDFTIAVKL